VIDINPSTRAGGYPGEILPDDTVRALNSALTGIRQRLRGHAGDVVVAEVSDGVVTLDYQGACRGCPALHFTHAAVVEPALERVEGVRRVAPPRSDISPAVLERIRRMARVHRPIPTGARSKASDPGA
jgi:Fe-S cluster biogenesis protein NfuA